MSEQLDKNTNQTDERLTKESLQLQKALWIREEVNKKRAQEDQLLDQIFREQQLLQEMDDDMDATSGMGASIVRISGSVLRTGSMRYMI